MPVSGTGPQSARIGVRSAEWQRRDRAEGGASRGRGGREPTVQLVGVDDLRTPGGAPRLGAGRRVVAVGDGWSSATGLSCPARSSSRHDGRAAGKLFVDQLLGPNADAAIIEELVALQARGSRACRAVPSRRAGSEAAGAGFIAVGGSLTPNGRR